jgi:UDP-N-acetylmuramoyl-L-alanine---L-glutamate ligase
VTGVVGMPANGPRIVAALAGAVPAVTEPDLAAAVARARVLVPPGGAILLSPGAPTGSDFRDFAARGDAFRALVGGDGRT